jgi:hypothetical protein
LGWLRSGTRPGAVEAVREWHERGHFVQVIGHPESQSARSGATAAWLRAIGLPFDTLEGTREKVELCVREGIELLIDDSPLSIVGALERGIVAATIVHPWNEEVCEEEDVICARDWHELARLLAPVVSASPPARRSKIGRHAAERAGAGRV